jgi:hypothetical protein
MTRIGSNDNYQNTQKSAYEDFGTYADNLNKTVPDRTTTKLEKERAIEVKEKLIKHPGCPNETKIALRKEIDIIKGEIQAIEHEESMNSSVFGDGKKLE